MSIGQYAQAFMVGYQCSAAVQSSLDKSTGRPGPQALTANCWTRCIGHSGISAVVRGCASGVSPAWCRPFGGSSCTELLQSMHPYMKQRDQLLCLCMCVHALAFTSQPTLHISSHIDMCSEFQTQVSLGPTLDTVHMLCAAFGEVAKIAMFEKASGLQALVQFKDGRHAKEAQQTLDGTSIPEHLVPNHPGKIMMKVSFSAHSDLQIRAQTDRSR